MLPLNTNKYIRMKLIISLLFMFLVMSSCHAQKPISEEKNVQSKVTTSNPKLVVGIVLIKCAMTTSQDLRVNMVTADLNV